MLIIHRKVILKECQYLNKERDEKDKIKNDQDIIEYIIEVWNILCKNYRAEVSYLLEENIILLHTSYHEEEAHSRFRFKNGILTIEYLELPSGLQNRGFTTTFLNNIEEEDNGITEIRFLSVKAPFMAELLEKKGYVSYVMSDLPRKCFKIRKNSNLG